MMVITLIRNYTVADQNIRDRTYNLLPSLFKYVLAIKWLLIIFDHFLLL